MSAPLPDSLWVTRGRLVTPEGIVDGAVRIARGRIAAIRFHAPRGAERVDVGGCYVAPGFIDLHVWGEPAILARELLRHGTTAFLSTIGPGPPRWLAQRVGEVCRGRRRFVGAECLGVHLEGPFLNPARGGVLPRRWMRSPTIRELGALLRGAKGGLKLMTVAPELRGALRAIAWSRRRGIVVSLGHSDAEARTAKRAIEAGARAVTHVFNGMRPFHHREPGVLGVALTDPRLCAMVILDGVHVSDLAFRLLVLAKGPERMALVTDSIERLGWNVIRRHGAYYDRRGVLAGSALTMMRAVHRAVVRGGVPLAEAVRMAADVPARLLGLGRTHGTLEVGKRADMAVFDGGFRVRATFVGGHLAYQA